MCARAHEDGEGRSVRAAVEREALKIGVDFFGFGTAPLGSPLRFGDVHAIFTVLFLPHRFALASNRIDNYNK